MTAFPGSNDHGASERRGRGKKQKLQSRAEAMAGRAGDKKGLKKLEEQKWAGWLADSKGERRQARSL